MFAFVFYFTEDSCKKNALKRQCNIVVLCKFGTVPTMQIFEVTMNIFIL